MNTNEKAWSILAYSSVSRHGLPGEEFAQDMLTSAVKITQSFASSRFISQTRV